MRSGSSTILSMMSATVHDNQNGTDVFSLYEPCHTHDKYRESMTKKLKEDISHCSDLVSMLTSCDFSQVVNLFHWSDPHTSNDHTTKFSHSVAEKLCKKAGFVAVKTVWPMFTQNVSWVLHENPHLKIIEVVRDPRGKFASQVEEQHGRSYPLENMDEDCLHFAENAKFTHPRLYRIVFDDLVTNPKGESKKVYKFLGRPWGQKQDDWVRDTFNADCVLTEAEKGNGKDHAAAMRHDDCHSDSAKSKLKWKKTLSGAQKTHFRKNEVCQEVRRKYHFED